VCLHPVADLLFGKHGGARVHLSTCGHGMHASCFNRLRTSLVTAARGRLSYQDSQAVNTHENEILCPLCKSLVNVLVPHVPPAAARLVARAPPPSTASSSAPVPVPLRRVLSKRALFPTDLPRWMAHGAAPIVANRAMSPEELKAFREGCGLAIGGVGAVVVASDADAAAAAYDPAGAAAVATYLSLSQLPSHVTGVTRALAQVGGQLEAKAALEDSPAAAMHTLASALAYTVMSAARAKSWIAQTAAASSSSDSGGAVSGVLAPADKEWPFLSQLLAGFLAHAGAKYAAHRMLDADMRRLLAGVGADAPSSVDQGQGQGQGQGLGQGCALAAACVEVPPPLAEGPEEGQRIVSVSHGPRPLTAHACSVFSLSPR